MNMNKIIVLLTALFALSGCATMNSDECLTSDWHAIGFEDGASGQNAERLGDRRKACSKHGVTPDFQAYQSGRDEGLEQFCQPSRGFSLGSRGGSYGGVCATHRELEFIDAFNSGYHLYNLRSRVNSANAQIAQKEKGITRNKEIMSEKEAILIATETTVQDRVLVLADLKELSEANGQLESEIVQLITERARHQQELASYEAVLADTGY